MPVTEDSQGEILRIAVVDPESSTRTLTCRILERRADLGRIELACGQDRDDAAVLRWAAEPPHLMVLHCGLEAIAEIRRAEAARGSLRMPIIFETGMASSLEAGIAAGADAALLRPFSPQDLVDAVRGLLGVAPVQPAPPPQGQVVEATAVQRDVVVAALDELHAAERLIAMLRSVLDHHFYLGHDISNLRFDLQRPGLGTPDLDPAGPSTEDLRRLAGSVATIRKRRSHVYIAFGRAMFYPTHEVATDLAAVVRTQSRALGPVDPPSCPVALSAREAAELVASLVDSVLPVPTPRLLLSRYPAAGTGRAWAYLRVVGQPDPARTVATVDRVSDAGLAGAAGGLVLRDPSGGYAIECWLPLLDVDLLAQMGIELDPPPRNLRTRLMETVRSQGCARPTAEHLALLALAGEDGLRVLTGIPDLEAALTTAAAHAVAHRAPSTDASEVAGLLSAAEAIAEMRGHATATAGDIVGALLNYPGAAVWVTLAKAGATPRTVEAAVRKQGRS